MSRKIFAPCERLMRRLKLAQKFGLIAIVLVAPLAFVTYSYYDTQNKQVVFADQERAGIVAIRPMVELLAAVGEARSAAAQATHPAFRTCRRSSTESTPCCRRCRATSAWTSHGRP